MKSTPTPALPTRAAGTEPPPSPPRRVPLRDLLGDADRLVIEHQGREYLLRVTSNGKLILTA